MKVLIIEDEALAAEKLEHLIKEIVPAAVVVGKFDSIEDSVDWLKKNSTAVDLIFMDIHLSDGLCFRIFEEVKIKKPIIFTTAYDQYAIEVFRFNSIYYLLKPITAKSLSDSLEKYDTLRTALIAPEIDYQHLLELLKKEHKEHKQRFLVKQGNKFLTVTIEEIALFYAEEKYVFLLKKDGRKCIINFTLDELENILDPVLFCRVNRKYILGIQTIQEVQVYYKGRLKVIAPLLKDTEILVSNEKAADFKKWLER